MSLVADLLVLAGGTTVLASLATQVAADLPPSCGLRRIGRPVLRVCGVLTRPLRRAAPRVADRVEPAEPPRGPSGVSSSHRDVDAVLVALRADADRIRRDAARATSRYGGPRGWVSGRWGP